jgi:aerobic-type carbon monoxide dehydrogenase small subunit (CoxS/CutS family)
MGQTVRLDVDGIVHQVTVDDPDMPLLYALRDELGLSNPRFGCGLAQCGACTVHVDGAPTRSCLTPLSSVAGSRVVTIAGLGTPDHPHKLQTAFAEVQATQCGYCMNGWMMTAAALVRDKPRASIDEIKDALSGLKCRCGTQMSIIRAIARVTGAA